MPTPSAASTSASNDFLTRMFGLGGSTVIVSGAGRGLGRDIAIAVAEAGATVVGVSRSTDELEAAAATAPVDRFVALPWDIADLDRADALVERAEQLAGPVHGVVHAAGVQHRARAEDMTVEDWQRVTRIDLDAPFFLSTAVHRRQRAIGRSGAHVFIGSLTSYLGIKNIGAYAASKSGLLGVIRTLAVEWADHGDRVNGVAPGYFHTTLTESLLADADRAAWVHSRIPMGRLGVGADLAAAVVFLLADGSGYLTGQMIGVDGGWLAG